MKQAQTMLKWLLAFILASILVSMLRFFAPYARLRDFADGVLGEYVFAVLKKIVNILVEMVADVAQPSDGGSSNGVDL
mgnify:CR=1 FL=1